MDEPDKPIYEGGGSEAEYKAYMVARLEYETWENRTLKRKMILQQHAVCYARD